MVQWWSILELHFKPLHTAGLLIAPAKLGSRQSHKMHTGEMASATMCRIAWHYCKLCFGLQHTVPVQVGTINLVCHSASCMHNTKQTYTKAVFASDRLLVINNWATRSTQLIRRAEANCKHCSCPQPEPMPTYSKLTHNLLSAHFCRHLKLKYIMQYNKYIMKCSIKR